MAGILDWLGSSINPAAMGQAGNTMSISGMLTSGIGAYYSTMAQQSALQYQATVAETNARLAERIVFLLLLQGQQQANQVQLKGAQVESAQRTSLAANGIDLGEGSAARVLSDTETLSQLDAQTTYANAVRAAWGYRTQATNQQNSALYSRSAADSMSPVASRAGSLLAGAGSVARNWYAQKITGV